MAFTMQRTHTMREHTVSPSALEREAPAAIEEESDEEVEAVKRPTSAERRRKEDKDREVGLRDHTGSVECLKFYVTHAGRLRLASAPWTPPSGAEKSGGEK